MHTEIRKKASIIYMLKILQEFTDADHRISQKEIVEKLDQEYGMKINRSTVRSNIDDLIAAGYEIGKKEVYRSYPNKKTGKKSDSVIYKELYYIPNISESELHMLSDCLLFSRSLPYEERRKLINKVGKLSCSYRTRGTNNTEKEEVDFLGDQIFKSDNRS